MISRTCSTYREYEAAILVTKPGGIIPVTLELFELLSDTILPANISIKVEQQEQELSIEGAIAQERFCIKCANLIGVRLNKSDNEKWKCGAPENAIGINMVTGDKTYRILECNRAREMSDSCGPTGKWFVIYNKPNYHDFPKQQEAPATIGGREPKVLSHAATEMRRKAAMRIGKVSPEDLENL